MWQEIIVLLAVIMAAGFIFRRYGRTLGAAKGKDGMRCGCGCDGCDESHSVDVSSNCELTEK